MSWYLFKNFIKRIIQNYEKYNKKPIISSTENTFKVTLYNVNYKESNSTKLPSNLSQEEKIIEYLKLNNKINRNIVEKLLDISSTRVKSIIKNMINDNIIKSIGNGKNIYYILK